MLSWLRIFSEFQLFEMSTDISPAPKSGARGTSLIHSLTPTCTRQDRYSRTRYGGFYGHIGIYTLHVVINAGEVGPRRGMSQPCRKA